ncbi:class I SAM-dependent rRNA methyltransferase [Treponema brennaborense]|uniref:Uncharacterized protein n=1 Tax=Treponema brennaborense (strain DSM 12168 / CIP 105900 / DD5/3) TaxID=906968 RepID=F4LKE8_TREBD|nr:class I SAM-dependent rRNA methyltransferase [Treponema brennaborense]AEE16522.1 protein of unknown function Met10 [Treponema brennaborense DSM 12168]
MNFPRVFLKSKEETEIRQGFPWVFDNEIAFVKYTDGAGSFQHELKDCSVADGTPVEVYSKSGQFLGTGIINRASKITVRILTPLKPETVFGESCDALKRETLHGERSRTFILERVESAFQARFFFYNKNDSYRLVFAEADLIPGLIAERYCDETGRVFLVVQFLSLSAEVFRDEIIDALRTVCRPFGIYERSDAAVRELEGLEQKKGWIGAEHNPIITIKENGVYLTVDLENGQKTGYFLDQKDNRRVVASLAKGRRVLDTFTHTGAFGLNAVAGGASEVVSVDISAEAVSLVESNIERNKAGHVMKAVCADVFDLLKQYESEGRQFDLIILDPPAFAKSAAKIEKAYGGYKEINLRAMKLLTPGGILVSCSCSHFFDHTVFYDMIMHAAADAHRRVQIFAKRGAGPDHPVLAGYPKSEYLKCALMRVL